MHRLRSRPSHADRKCRRLLHEKISHPAVFSVRVSFAFIAERWLFSEMRQRRPLAIHQRHHGQGRHHGRVEDMKGDLLGAAQADRSPSAEASTRRGIKLTRD